MKKVTFLFFILFFTKFCLIAQSVVPENFYSIKARKDAYYDSIKVVAGIDALNEDESGYAQYQLWLRLWEPRVYPFQGDFVALNSSLNNNMQARLSNNNQSVSSVTSNWSQVGPYDQPLENLSSGQLGSQIGGTGRIDFITIDPNNVNNLIAGSPVGGLFYSTDGGEHWWNAETDQLPQSTTIGMSCCAISPTGGNAPNIFTATGDNPAWPNDVEWTQSTGVFRSLNAGFSGAPFNWQLIGSQTQLNGYWPWEIKKILIDPLNTNILYVATSNGIYKTINALDPNPANVSWSILHTGAAANAGGNDAYAFNDILFKPGQTGISNQIIYASRDATGNQPTANIIMSSDGGITWSEFDNGINLNNCKRVAIETSNANPNMLYALTASSGGYSYIYSINSSSQTLWTSLAFNPVPSPDYGGAGIDPSRIKSFCVSPTATYPNEKILFGDTYPIYYSTDGGNSYSPNNSNSPPHNDIRNIEFSPDGLTLWATCDGGVFKSTDNGNTWIPKNYGLGVETINGMAWSESDPDYVLTGDQDCGTNLFDGTNWEHVYPADGMTPMIDYKNPANMYASFQGAVVARSSDYGNTFPFPASSAISSDFFSVEVMNTKDPSTYYETGQEIRRTMNQGVTWSTMSNFGATYGSGNYLGLELFTAPSNPDYLYCWLKPLTNVGQFKLVFTTNANASNVTWSGDIQSTAITPRWLNGVAVDENDPNNIYTAFGNAGASSGKIFNVSVSATPNASIWRDITADLPTWVDALAIVKEKGSNGGLYVGTDNGVYYTNNNYINAYLATGALPVWQPFSTNLPHTRLMWGLPTMIINYTSNKIRVGTFGRGVWESDLACPPNNDDVESNTYSSDVFIEAEHNISSTATTATNKIIYRAGNQIDLQPGFSISATNTNTSFHGFIHGCDHAGNSFRKSNTNKPVRNANTDNTLGLSVNEEYREQITKQKSIGVIPNPNGGAFNILINDNEKEVNYSITITDVSGRVVKDIQHVADKNIKMDLTSLPNGFYFLKLVAPNWQSLNKVVIQNQ
jgi:hypothetical protein